MSTSVASTQMSATKTTVRDGPKSGSCERFRRSRVATGCHVNSMTRFISTLRSEIRVHCARARERATLTVTSLVPFLITGEGDDYLTVSLRDGGAAVGMTLAKGRLDLHIKPARVRFDDNQWHKIVVHRKVQEVTIMSLFIL